MEGPKAIGDKLERALTAWETLRPTKTFGGMTLEAFKTAVQPSFDARTALQTLQAQLTAAQNAREDADEVSLAKFQLVINGIIGDPEEGPDGELYEAMGYVRKSEKKSGLTRKKVTG